MDYKQILNSKYADLCKQLGDLTFRRAAMEVAIADISAEIRGLNTTMSALNAATPPPMPTVKSVQQEALNVEESQAAAKT